MIIVLIKEGCLKSMVSMSLVVTWLVQLSVIIMWWSLTVVTPGIRGPGVTNVYTHLHSHISHPRHLDQVENYSLTNGHGDWYHENCVVFKKLQNKNSIHPICNIFTYYKRQIDITARGSMCDDIAGQIFSNNNKTENRNYLFEGMLKYSSPDGLVCLTFDGWFNI